jgi:bifunctional non-homologous end joining protein LigD
MTPKKAVRKRSAAPRARSVKSSKPVVVDSAEAEERLREYRRKRDFSRTQEPRGGRGPAHSKVKLAFVIQKHAASHLHYDLRLELDGVMKSWAVPKGPSLDPAVKRLAMEVEDHPIEYNSFEGTIPQGEYGGGTVMLWDRGTYTYGGSDTDPIEGLQRGFGKGDFKFLLHGKRLRGSWVLVRTRRDPRGRAQWLLIKHRDEYAAPGSDVTAEYQTSVATERTMEEIAAGKSRVWHSNRAERQKDASPAPSGHGARPQAASGQTAYQRLMARRTR